CQLDIEVEILNIGLKSFHAFWSVREGGGWDAVYCNLVPGRGGCHSGRLFVHCLGGLLDGCAVIEEEVSGTVLPGEQDEVELHAVGDAHDDKVGGRSGCLQVGVDGVSEVDLAFVN